MISYFQNRIQSKTKEKVFNDLKMIKERKVEEEKEQYSLMKKAFEGLRMFYKQKTLLSKYLSEYETFSYYPRSTEELNQFKEIVSRDC